MSRTTAFLLLVCLLAAIPMLYFGVTYYIEYDGYWHVFIAKQAWSNLLVEYQATAHPPLFFLLLRAATGLGDSRLIYRLVSILSGIGAILVIGRIASKVTGSALAAVLTAFVFGLSGTAILISIEVRSYMLCALFVLLAFYFYLDIVNIQPGQSDRRARAGFSVSLCLAVLSHYSALFFLLACLAAPVWLAVLNADYRARFLIILRARWLANLAPFYFDPAGQESRMAFLLRNLHNMFNLFSPVSAGDAAKFGPALTALFGFTGMAVYFARIRVASRDILTSLTTAVFLLMLAAFMAAGLRGRYPFGGGLRHQFLLFPFLALGSVTLLDRLAALIRVPHARTAVLALGFVAAGANAKTRFDSFQNIRSDHATRDVAVFRNLFPNPDAVLLDQFSVVNFFTHYYDWKWRTTGKYGSLYTYAVSRNGDEFTVLRDQSLWNFDFGEAHLYWSVQQALARAPGHSITVFCIDQFGSHVPRTPDQEQVFRTKARTLASQAGLELTRLFVDGQDVYANFVYAHGYRQMADLDLNGPTVLLAQPQETTVKTRFETQPNGQSAISLTGRNFERGAVVFANGRKLDASFGNSHWMTALFPPDLYAAAGVVELKVVNPDGKSSNAIDFLVRPK